MILCDFGNATILNDCRRKHTLEAIRDNDGVEEVTLPYRAPELLAGMADFGPPVDFWSLAVTMAELACKPRWFYRESSPAPLRMKQAELCVALWAGWAS